MEKYCISVDWLQCYCLKKETGCICNNKRYISGIYSFTSQELSIQSAMFQTLYKVMLNNMTVATLEMNPRSSALNAKMVLVKLENRILYSCEYIAILYAIFDAFDLIYKGITRIDLCYDCNKFEGGKSPARFIQNFVFSNDTTSTQIARKGRDEFTCHGKKTKSSGTRINYISFGSGKSKYRSYIYDKTVELDEVKDKPWIRRAWEENGIVSNEKMHVWRSEISIKSEGTDLINMSTGELFRLSPIFLENQKAMEKLFHYYAARTLSFLKGTGQKKKKDYKPIILFENAPEITVKPITINKDLDTGRIEKVCYNVLDRLSKTYTDLAAYRSKSLKDCMDFLKELSGIKSGILAQKKYERYLDEFKCFMFPGQETLNYLAQIEETHRKKIKISDQDIDYLYFEMLESKNKYKDDNPDLNYYLYYSFMNKYAEKKESVPILGL